MVASRWQRMEDWIGSLAPEANVLPLVLSGRLYKYRFSNYYLLLF